MLERIRNTRRGFERAFMKIYMSENRVGSGYKPDSEEWREIGDAALTASTWYDAVFKTQALVGTILIAGSTVIKNKWLRTTSAALGLVAIRSAFESHGSREEMLRKVTLSSTMAELESYKEAARERQRPSGNRS